MERKKPCALWNEGCKGFSSHTRPAYCCAAVRDHFPASNFTAQTAGYGSSDTFNSARFLRIDERAVQSLTGPVKWTSQSNRTLVSDSVEFAEEMAFLPYAPVTREDVETFAAFLRDEDGGIERRT